MRNELQAANRYQPNKEIVDLCVGHNCLCGDFRGGWSCHTYY